MRATWLYPTIANVDQATRDRLAVEHAELNRRLLAVLGQDTANGTSDASESAAQDEPDR